MRRYEWLKRLILRLITRRHSFKSYPACTGGLGMNKDVWLHERWWRIFSRKKHSKVRKVEKESIN